MVANRTPVQSRRARNRRGHHSAARKRPRSTPLLCARLVSRAPSTANWSKTTATNMQSSLSLPHSCPKLLSVENETRESIPQQQLLPVRLGLGQQRQQNVPHFRR